MTNCTSSPAFLSLILVKSRRNSCAAPPLILTDHPPSRIVDVTSRIDMPPPRCRRMLCVVGARVSSISISFFLSLPLYRNAAVYYIADILRGREYQRRTLAYIDKGEECIQNVGQRTSLKDNLETKTLQIMFT